MDVTVPACGTGTSDAAFLNISGVCEPETLKAYDTGDGGELGLNWSPNPSADITGYRLYSRDEFTPTFTTEDLPLQSSLLQEGLDDGTRYFFRVTALVRSAESPFSPESSALSTAGGFELPQAAEYGYNTPVSGDTSHADVVTYRFPGRSGDVTLLFEAYDLSVDEAELFTNGGSAGKLASTAAGNWSSQREIVLADADVDDVKHNVLTFDNLLFFPGPGPEDDWGARQVSVKLPAPVITTTGWSQTIDVGIQQWPLEPSLFGYDVHRSTTSGFFPSPVNRIAQGVNGAAYRDDTVTDGVAYFYRLIPVDTIDNRGFTSNETSGTPSASIVTPVGDLRIAKAGADDLMLEWSQVTTFAGVDEYDIYEGPVPSSPLVFTGNSTSTTSFLRAGDQSDGVAHYYSVITRDNNGDTAPTCIGNCQP